VKLTTTQLKQIIKEELANVMAEYRTIPQFPEGFPEDFQAKIHSLIDSGDEQNIEMARSLMDSFGEADYVDGYIDYQQVGTPEKLGNKARDLNISSRNSDTKSKIGYLRKKLKLNDEVYEKLKAIADRTGEDYDDLYDRYVDNMFAKVSSAFSEAKEHHDGEVVEKFDSKAEAKKFIKDKGNTAMKIKEKDGKFHVIETE